MVPIALFVHKHSSSLLRSDGNPEEVKEPEEDAAEREPPKKDEESTDGGGGGGDGGAEERVRSLEEQLAFSQAELEELREQVQVGVFSVERAETGRSEGEGEGVPQQLRERVRQLEAELAERRAPPGESDAARQLRVKVDELQRALEQEREASGARRKNERKKEEEKTHREEEEESEAVRRLKERVSELEASLAEKSKREKKEEEKKEAGEREQQSGERRSGEGELARHLQARTGELEAQLRGSVPRTELDEVRVTMALQLDQLARERAQLSLRLNDALLELERLRPQSNGDEEDDEGLDEDERSEGSERSIISGEGSLWAFVQLSISRVLGSFSVWLIIF